MGGVADRRFDAAVSTDRLLALENVSIKIDGVGERLLVRDLSLEIRRGDSVGIIGPNGSGKSTLIKSLIGVREIEYGRLAGADSKYTQCYLPQDYRNFLFPWITLKSYLDVVLSHDERIQFFSSLKEWNVSLNENQRIDSFSGGEQQIIALSVIMAKAAVMVYLDEPFSAIDIRRRSQALKITDAYLKASGSALVVVSHQTQDIAALTERCMIISGDGEGVVTIIERDGADRASYHERIVSAYA